jgi:hypothetical protein
MGATRPLRTRPRLGATSLARSEHATEATLARARAQSADPRRRSELLARAEAHQHLADSLELREAVLSGIDTQRSRWHDATAQARAAARDATGELRRRLPDAELPAFHDEAPGYERAADHAPQASRPRPASLAQPALSSADLHRAAELAEVARRTLDQRQAQAQRNAELDRQRQADEPSPGRWPHRDPGYEPGAMRRRQAGRTAAQLVAQDFPTGQPDLSAGPDWPEPGHGSPRPRPRDAERDEPEATL